MGVGAAKPLFSMGAPILCVGGTNLFIADGLTYVVPVFIRRLGKEWLTRPPSPPACSSNSTSYACSNLVSSRGLWLFTGEMFAGVRPIHPSVMAGSIGEGRSC